MRFSRSLVQVAGLALGFSTVTAAWPSFMPPIEALIARQDDSDTTTAEATATADSDTSTITKAPAASTGDLNTASVGTDKTASTRSGSSNSTTKKETFDSRSPAGGVSMIVPQTTSMNLYKIGDYVTLSWNYTSCLADPTAVDLIAVDSSASKTHTLTQNMTFESPADFTWDTEAYQEENAQLNALRVAEYTLIIYDSDGTPTDTATPGYLSPYSGFSFGLYTPQSYTSLSDWTCTTCSDASDLLAHPAAGIAVTFAFAAGVALAAL